MPFNGISSNLRQILYVYVYVYVCVQKLLFICQYFIY